MDSNRAGGILHIIANPLLLVEQGIVFAGLLDQVTVLFILIDNKFDFRIAHLRASLKHIHSRIHFLLGNALFRLGQFLFLLRNIVQGLHPDLGAVGRIVGNLHLRIDVHPGISLHQFEGVVALEELITQLGSLPG